LLLLKLQDVWLLVTVDIIYICGSRNPPDPGMWISGRTQHIQRQLKTFSGHRQKPTYAVIHTALSCSYFMKGRFL